MSYRTSHCRNLRCTPLNYQFADAVQPRPEEFVVGPAGTNAPYHTIQAGIDAAAAGGERTLFNPALVRVLPGAYPDQVVTLRKHVHVWGAGTKDEAISFFNGYVVVDLAPDPFGAFVEWRGMGVNAPLGAPAGIHFTGSNPQALGLEDDIVTGSAVSLLMDNTSTVNATVEANLVQLAPLSAAFQAVVQDSGLLQVKYSELTNTNLVGGESPEVLRFGPTSAHARGLLAIVDYSTIIGRVAVDGRLSTATADNTIVVVLGYCPQSTTTATAKPLVNTTGAVAPNVVSVGLYYHLLAPSNWVAGNPAVQGTPLFSTVKVQNAAVSGKGSLDGVPFSSLTDTFYAISDPVPFVS